MYAWMSGSDEGLSIDREMMANKAKVFTLDFRLFSLQVIYYLKHDGVQEAFELLKGMYV